MTAGIVSILKLEGFIQDFEILPEGINKVIIIALKYTGKQRTPIITTLKRVSKPGVRVYVGNRNLPKILGNMGTAIISTSQGLMTDSQARKLKVGGEVLCYIW
jgi:small subunit ribosomal protein S8